MERCAHDGVSLDMKRMLIIYPYWPPSNLVGVHRVRMIANELHSLGWKTTVLTIDERDYEEPLSQDLKMLVSPEVEIIKVRAAQVYSFLGRRLIGDISLRGWFSMREMARTLLKTRGYDFIWISVSPWYTALMGYGLKKKYNVPYGIDFQDPWDYKLASHERGLNRATITLAVARVLQPIALRNVNLITGISEAYIKQTLRNLKQARQTNITTFQNGFAQRDHTVQLETFSSPLNPKKRSFVYAGAHWPLGAPLFTLWLKAIASIHQETPLENLEFVFIGTGNSQLRSIDDQAKSLGLEGVVIELPERRSYLEIQQILRESDGAMVIGSIEPHYSASKIFQCLCTAPRTFGFFHADSEGREVLETCRALKYYAPFHPDWSEEDCISKLKHALLSFINPEVEWQPLLENLAEYTSHSNAKKFIQAVEETL